VVYIEFQCLFVYLLSTAYRGTARILRH